MDFGVLSSVLTHSVGLGKAAEHHCHHKEHVGKIAQGKATVTSWVDAMV